MPEVTNYNPLSFERGLYDISEFKTEEAEGAKLPQQSKILPSQETISQQLKEVVTEKTLEKGLMEALKPNVKDQSVLLPQNFKPVIYPLYP